MRVFRSRQQERTQNWQSAIQYPDSGIRLRLQRRADVAASIRHWRLERIAALITPYVVGQCVNPSPAVVTIPGGTAISLSEIAARQKEPRHEGRNSAHNPWWWGKTFVTRGRNESLIQLAPVRLVGGTTNEVVLQFVALELVSTGVVSAMLPPRWLLRELESARVSISVMYWKMRHWAVTATAVPGGSWRSRCLSEQLWVVLALVALVIDTILRSQWYLI